MNIIMLTEYQEGKSILVNLNHVMDIGPSVRGGTLITYRDGTHRTVVETPAQIKGKVSEEGTMK